MISRDATFDTSASMNGSPTGAAPIGSWPLEWVFWTHGRAVAVDSVSTRRITKPTGWVVDMRHYLDEETGDLPEAIPERVLSLAVFFGSIVAWVTDHLPQGDWLSVCGEVAERLKAAVCQGRPRFVFYWPLGWRWLTADRDPTTFGHTFGHTRVRRLYALRAPSDSRRRSCSGQQPIRSPNCARASLDTPQKNDCFNRSRTCATLNDLLGPGRLALFLNFIDGHRFRHSLRARQALAAGRD